MRLNPEFEVNTQIQDQLNIDRVLKCNRESMGFLANGTGTHVEEGTELLPAPAHGNHLDMNRN